MKIICELLGCEAHEVVPTSTFRSLGAMDELDYFQLATAYEEAFGIAIPAAGIPKLKTVQAAADYLAVRKVP